MIETVLNSRRRLSALLALATVACGVGLYFGYPYFVEGMTRLLDWTNDLGRWSPFVFTGIVIVAVVLLVPGLLLSLSAGFMFGVVKGSFCIWIGTNVGAAIAFLIGRHMMGERIAEYLRRHEKVRRLDDVLKQQGWKVVMLTRMVPFFPFKLSNYVFGIAGFKLWHFCLGTAIGTIPITVFNVYTGSLAGDLAEVAQSGSAGTAHMWIVRLILLIAAGMLLLYITHAARKALREDSDQV